MSSEYLERKELNDKIKHSKSIRKYHSKHRRCKYCTHCYFQRTPPLSRYHGIEGYHKCDIKNKCVNESFPRWFCGFFEPTSNHDFPPVRDWKIPPPPPRTKQNGKDEC